MKILIPIVMSLLFIGCDRNMTPEEMASMIKNCKELGLKPVQVKYLFDDAVVIQCRMEDDKDIK